jgi:hypothetical protein
MRKKTIAILFIIGIVLGIIGGVFFGIASAGIATATLAANTAGATQDSINAAVAAAGASAAVPLLVGGIILAIAGILSTISWIGALVATAKQGRWGWFVCVLLLTGLGELIYLIAGPSLNAGPAAVQQM